MPRTAPIAASAALALASMRALHTNLAPERARLSGHADTVATPSIPVESYTGRDSVTGIPRYIPREFSQAERLALRAQFGIDEPSRLYRNDGGFLVYDARSDMGLRDFVVTHRVGGVSTRRPGESYAEFEVRIAGKPAAYFGAGVATPERRLSALAPEVQPAFRALIDDARRADIPVTVVETYRSPARQAYLLAQGRGLTFTATSTHSDGRAVDFCIGSGHTGDPRTRAQYAAFRSIAASRGFVLEGPWDPGHVALPDTVAQPGFRTIEQLLAAAMRPTSTVATH